MNIHYLQHVPFEGLGSIESVLRERGHCVSATRLYQGEKLPPLKELDWLIVLGGPMSVFAETEYAWLSAEKKFIEKAVRAEKKILGICLGAQLIADVLGAGVYANRYREIGWFMLERSIDAASTFLASALPDRIEVFHWHGDTFDIPQSAVRIGSSKACRNQGFVYGQRVVALQFHLETTPQSMDELITNCKDELDNSRYVQSARQMAGNPDRFVQINRVMNDIVTVFES